MPTEAVEQPTLTRGDRVIHLHHGEGRVSEVDAARGIITATFRNESSTQYSKTWRDLIGRGYITAAAQEGRGVADPLTISVKLDVVLDPSKETWSIPDSITDYPAHLVYITDYIENTELQVYPNTLKTVWPGLRNFARVLEYLKCVKRSSLKDLLEAITEGVDMFTGAHVLNCCTKRGAARDEVFDRVIGRLGTVAWTDSIHVGISSPGQRAELDRIVMALVYMSTPPSLHDDRDALAETAVLIRDAIERRVAKHFTSILTGRRVQTPTKPSATTVDIESDVLAASE